MTLPANGAITFSEIAGVCRGSNTQIGLSDWDVRYLLGRDKGQIKLSDAYGKPSPGSRTYSTPGTYTFLVPPFITLSVDVMGGSGGGGGGSDHFPYLYCWGGGSGSSGGISRFASTVPVIGYGGAGGPAGYCGGKAPNGSNGSASGGDTNTTGYSGGSGGHGSGAPGAGSPNTDGGNGGASGRAIKEWTHLVTENTPAWKSNVTVVVGSAGYGGGAGSAWCAPGSYGTGGYVTITWE